MPSRTTTMTTTAAAPGQATPAWAAASLPEGSAAACPAGHANTGEGS